MEVFVEAFVSDTRSVVRELANHAYFSFVALDEDTLKPKKIPAVLPETEEEKKYFESALTRRELRLLLSGKIETEDAKVLKEIVDGKKMIF